MLLFLELSAGLADVLVDGNRQVDGNFPSSNKFGLTDACVIRSGFKLELIFTEIQFTHLLLPFAWLGST